MRLLRFGQRVETAQGGLIQWTMGSAFKREALNCIRGLLTKGRLRSEQLVAFGRQLENYRSSREGFVFAAKTEYWLVLDQIDKLANKEFTSEDFFLATEEELTNRGVELHLGDGIKELQVEGSVATAVELQSGTVLEAELVIEGIVVPEPGLGMMVLVGIAAIACSRRRVRVR